MVVLSGVGIRRTTFVAESLLLKLALMVTTYDTWDVPISFTVGIIRNGNLTFDVERYLSGVRRVNSNACRPNIPHQFEFTVGGDKANGAGRIEVI